MGAPLTPTGVFSYPGDTQIQDILLLPDGSHALLLLRIGAVNLWSLLAYHWVDILAAIAVALILYVLLRLIRRPRETGKPYCRRCNYALVGVNSPSCPECGLQLRGRNRVIGRRRGPRIMVLSVALGLIVANYALEFRRMTRTDSSWCQWLSPGLYGWARDNGQEWLTRHKSWRCRIVQIDLADGSITRTLFSRDGIIGGEFALHPDGKSFFLSQGDRVSQHDLRDGRELATLLAADAGEKRFQQVSVNATGDTVYTATMGNAVWAWRPANESHSEIIGRKTQLLDRAVLVPQSDRVLVRIPDSEVRLRWALLDLTTKKPIPGFLSSYSDCRPSQDGRWVFNAETDAVSVWDPYTGAHQSTLAVPWMTTAGGSQFLDGDARFVIVPEQSKAELHLWDLEASAWAGACAGPASLWFHPRLSVDRSLLVALGLNTTGGQTRYNIVTWKLPK